MAAALAVVGDVFDLFGRPVPELEIVSHYTSAFLQLLVQQRLDFGIDRVRQQVNGDQVRGAIVLLQEIAIDDVGVLFQSELADLFGALPPQVRVQLHAHGLGMELLGSHEDDAAVAGAQVEHLLTRLEAAQVEHLLDDGFRRGIIGREFLGVRVLRRQRGAAEHCKQAKSWHNSYVSRTVDNLPPSRSTRTTSFSTQLWKSL